MNNRFQHIPCGASLPANNPHAVSVNLPLMSDIIGYEENDPKIKDTMQSGYPRFFTNKLLEQVISFVRQQLHIGNEFELLSINNPNSKAILETYIGKKIDIIEFENFGFVKIAQIDVDFQKTKDILRHIGMVPSSRKAEDFLLKHHLISNEFKEEIADSNTAIGTIRNILSTAYGNSNEEDVFLCNSGMNAMFTAYHSLKVLQEKNDKHIFIQLGWLYMDSIDIIRKFSTKSIQILNLANLIELQAYLESNHNKVAAIITEIPNNPLVQCVDLPLLREITNKYNIPLAVDSTIGTPYNVEVLSYCDIAVESLTKFASGGADVMMGAVVLNINSRFAEKLREFVSKTADTPYIKDIQRIANEITGYEERVTKVASNTAALLSYFEQSPIVSQTFSVLSPASIGNFNKIKKHDAALPGLISIVFDKKLECYYDKLPLSKGPSLGTEFTLAMPYVYLAHYDLLKTDEGRKELERLGVHPELLRISVGIEPIDELIEVFKALELRAD